MVRGLKRSCGFTLIELVFVLVLIGVLGAVALPKFVNVRGDAFKSVVGATAGNLQTSANLSRMLCVTRNWANRDNLTGYGNGTIDFSSTCWPTDSSNNNSTVANAARCVRIFQGVLSTSITVATATASNPDFQVTISGGRCRFTYRRDTTVRRFDYEPGTGNIVNLVNP